MILQAVESALADFGQRKERQAVKVSVRGVSRGKTDQRERQRREREIMNVRGERKTERGQKERDVRRERYDRKRDKDGRERRG